MRIALTIDANGLSSDILFDADEATLAADVEQALSAELGADLFLGSGEVGDLLVNGMAIGPNGARVPPVVAQGLQLHVVGGPDAGMIFGLPLGRHEAGRSGRISWNDISLSRRHVAFEVTSGAVTVTDLGSSNGTQIDGIPCPQGVPTPWVQGQLLEIGDSVAVLREARTSDAVVELAEPGWRTFLRPPRIHGRYVQPNVDVPMAPKETKKRRFPVATMILPLVMGGAMYFVMKSPMYLLFTLMSPLMMVSNYISDRRGGVKDYKAAVVEYETALATAQERLTTAVLAEQARLRDEQPDAAETLLTSVLPGRRLWERRQHDADALKIRVGLSDQASTVKMTGASPTDDHQLRMVPQSFDLRHSPVVGIAGDPAIADGIFRWSIGQLATHHAPRDLSMIFLSVTAGPSWKWLQWLPHLRPADADTCVAMVGNDPETVAAQVGYAIAVIRAREQLAATNRSATADQFPPMVVLMHGFRSLRNVADVATVVADGPAVGVYTLCTDNSELTLPERAAAVVSVRADEPAYGSLRVSGADPINDVLLEGVSEAWAERLARGMAPFKDVSGGEGGDALPESARLLDVLNLDPPTPDALSARWRAEPRSTTMALGVGLNGAFKLDLKADGPHGLIAGMTGSGKTELLQTIIASLAVANRPEWLNFVLIDYKGDSAFKDCVNLPHTVGKVNDLNPFLVERALASLEAELDVRKNILAEAAVKDIEDYHDLLLKEPHRAPLPRLVLVIDEFAELAKELPDFMEGLVSIAQLGRSLGVHLLLATQRPSGVVSPSIRANTNMRIALRVADVSDSQDVLNSPESAKIPKSAPGRGFARLGANALLAFQAGRVGGRRPGAVVVDLPKPFLAPLSWPALGYAPPQRTEEKVQQEVSDTDLASLVEALRAVAAAENIPAQRQPWLDPLPDSLMWSNDGVAKPVGSAVSALPFGRSDVPSMQRQQPTCFDLARDGHLYVIGAPGTGRSQALRALIASIAALTSPTDVHLYGLDCGTGALNAAMALPHCGAVVSRSETERAARLLGRLAAELDARQQRMAAHGFGDISEQRRGDAEPLPHIVFMLDRWEGFTPTLGEVDGNTETVQRLLREGASAGIHLVITGDRSLVTNSRMATMTDNKFTLRLAEKSDYMLVGMNGKKIPDKLPAGRCYGPGMLETQVFLLDPDSSGQTQARILKQLGEYSAHRTADKVGSRPFRLDALPQRITLAEASALPKQSGIRLIVGVGGDELMALGPDAGHAGSFIVAGPGRSGRSTVLLGAAQSALAAEMAVVVVAPRPSPLRDLDGEPGVVAVLAQDITTEALDAAVEQAGGRRLLVVVDDGEGLRDTPANDFFLRLVRGGLPQAFLLLGGQADGVAAGLSGWQIEAKKARQGLLLSPQNITDGDLIGVRVPRQSIGGPVQVGKGLLHLGDGVLTPVATLA